MPTSMLSGRAIQHIRRMQADLFQTGLKMANPQLSVSFERYNPATTSWDTIPAQRVMLRWRHDKKLIRVYGELRTPMATSPTILDGMFMAFVPFNVKTGDRFTVQSVSGRINHVWPPRNGRQRASFTVESDKRTV